MSQLQAFQATVAHQRPPRLLAYADFAPDVRHRLCQRHGTEDLASHYDMFTPVRCEPLWLTDRPPVDTAAYYHGEELPPGTTFNIFGVAKIPGPCYHFTRHLSPLRHAQHLVDIEQFPIDDFGDWDATVLRPHVERAHAAGKVTAAYIGDLYETAWQIRGYEAFLMDMVARPAWAECLLERLAQRNLVLAEACATSGVDLVQCGDDIAHQHGMMFALDVWRRLIHARWQRVWSRIKAVNSETKIWYHSDGNMTAVVGELIDAGVDILNPLQPECLDLDALHGQYGHRVTFDGTIGTQTTMPWGATADVRQAVRHAIEHFGSHGGLILSPTHVLEPDVPLANIEAFFEACHEYDEIASSPDRDATPSGSQ